MTRDVDSVAVAIREAAYKYEGKKALTLWSDLSSEDKEYWRTMAEAAINSKKLVMT